MFESIEHKFQLITISFVCCLKLFCTYQFSVVFVLAVPVVVVAVDNGMVALVQPKIDGGARGVELEGIKIGPGENFGPNQFCLWKCEHKNELEGKRFSFF